MDFTMPAWGQLYNNLLMGDLGVQEQAANVQVRQQQALALQQQTASNAALMKALQTVGQEPPMQPGTAPEDQGIMGQIQGQIMGLQKQANMLDTLARTPGISPDRAMSLMNESMAVKKNIAAESANLLKERTDLYTKMGNIAGGVRTQDDLDLATAQMKRLDPDTLNRLPIDRDPMTGRPIMTARTAQVMNNFAMGSMTQADRLAREQQQQNELDRVEQRKANLEQRQREEQDRNERAALARAGIEQNRQAIQERHEDAVSQRLYSQAERISNDYKTDDQVKQFADHKKMYMTAYNYVFDENGQVKPEGAPGTPEWGNHDSASDFELSKQFIAMTHPHYRGTSYDAKELRSMANLPEHLANMIAGVAAGRVLAQSDRVNMVNAMKRVIANENGDQIQREDNAVKKINDLSTGIKVDVPIIPDNYVTKYAFRPSNQGGTTTGQQQAAPAATAPAGQLTAINPKTKQRVISNDGGKTWLPLPLNQ